MSTTFHYTDSHELVAQYIAKRMRSALGAKQHVLFLVPGGSGITVAVRVSQLLSDIALKKLSITLTDERFGPIAHDESNWAQLTKNGFSMTGATLLPVLSGANLEHTILNFDQSLARLFQENDYRIGLFGIGIDGHTAGILPGSSAVTAKTLACGYEAEMFTRITMTPRAIAYLDEAIVYAMGHSKKEVLQSMRGDIALDKQPAQALKHAGKLDIFSDQVNRV